MVVDVVVLTEEEVVDEEAVEAADGEVVAEEALEVRTL